MIDLTLPCWCVAAWLTFVAGAPAFAQDTSPVQAISPQAGAGSCWRQLGGAIPTPIPLALGLTAPTVLTGSLPFEQSCPNLSDQQTSEEERRISYGVEIAFSSGHADRGFILSDRPVVQPVLWLSGSGAELSVWGNFTLGETTDGSRPQIVEVELTREHEWRHVTIGPAIRMFVNHDPLSRYSTRSVEAWLYLSYKAGPFRLFSNHSLDVLTYRGAYFGEAGIEAEGHVAQRVEIGGSFAAGWASSTFNDAYADIAKSALDRISVEGWLTAYRKSHFYIGPRFEFSAIVDRAVRAELIRPTYFLIRLTTGAEF